MNCLDNLSDKKYVFSKLPSISILSLKNGIEIFKEETEKIYNKDNEKELKIIVNLIYYKLNTKNKDFSWTSKEYKEFKKIMHRIDEKKLKIIAPIVIKCLLVHNSNIYNQLKSFSQKVNWYPPKEKIKDSVTNKYFFIDKEIELSDCFYIINNLTSYIYQHINNYASNIESELLDEDINKILEEVKDDFLKTLEEKFGFVREYSLFSDLYIKLYEDSLRRLSKTIYALKSNIEYQKVKRVHYGADRSVKRHTTPLREYSKTYKKING